MHCLQWTRPAAITVTQKEFNDGNASFCQPKTTLKQFKLILCRHSGFSSNQSAVLCVSIKACIPTSDTTTFYQRFHFSFKKKKQTNFSLSWYHQTVTLVFPLFRKTAIKRFFSFKTGYFLEARPHYVALAGLKSLCRLRWPWVQRICLAPPPECRLPFLYSWKSLPAKLNCVNPSEPKRHT